MMLSGFVTWVFDKEKKKRLRPQLIEINEKCCSFFNDKIRNKWPNQNMPFSLDTNNSSKTETLRQWLQYKWFKNKIDFTVKRSDLFYI